VVLEEDRGVGGRSWCWRKILLLEEGGGVGKVVVLDEGSVVLDWRKLVMLEKGRGVGGRGC
jgi:hypothetical protein